MNRFGGDDPIDPFFSDSENSFRRCPFAGEPKSGESDTDSSDCEAFHVESTGIFMESVSDSYEDNAASAKVSVTDLGRDTDLGLNSEVQSTMKTVNNSIEDRSHSSGGGSKVSSVGPDNEDSGKRKLKGIADEKEKVSDGENGETHCNYKEKSAEKDVKENSRGMEDGNVSSGETHCNNKETSAGKEVKESAKTSQSHQQNKLLEEIVNVLQSSTRVLPPSVSGVKQNAAGKNSNASEDNPVEATLLEILKILKGEQESEIDDESLSKLSILDIVQRRGMTFPRPEWWPPEF